jgi:hypothetical protein
MTSHPRPEAGDPTDQSPQQTTEKISPQLFVPNLQRSSLQLDIVQRYEARVFNPNGPLTASDAIAKTLLVLAQLQTYDPVILQCATGYPLRFLSSLIWTLLRNEEWLSPFNYLELVGLASGRPQDDARLDNLTEWLLEQIWEQDSRDQVDLEHEWYECTGVPVGS